METISSPAAPPFPYAGQLACLAAAIIWAGSVTLYRKFGHGHSPSALSLFKNVLALICLGAAAAIVRPEWPASSAACWWLMASGVVGLVIGDLAFFAALPRLGAQMTTACQCLAPPLTAGIAIFFLGETLSGLELAGLGITVAAVAGAIFFGKNGGSAAAGMPARTFFAGLSLAFLAALAQAVGIVIARQAFQEIHLLLGTILRFLPATAVLLAVQLCFYGRPALQTFFTSRRQAAALHLAAFAGTFLGVLLLAAGTKYAKAGIVSTLTSTHPLWIIPVARLVLKERTPWPTIACTAIAVLGIGLMFLRR